jgi:hypothetical protein
VKRRLSLGSVGVAGGSARVADSRAGLERAYSPEHVARLYEPVVTIARHRVVSDTGE